MASDVLSDNMKHESRRANPVWFWTRAMRGKTRPGFSSGRDWPR